MGHKGQLYVMHQLVPTQKVLTIDVATGTTQLAFDNTAAPMLSSLHSQRASVRGGSQAIWIEEQGVYLAVAHVSRGRTMYTHFLVAFRGSPPFDVVALSREWCLAHSEDLGSGPEILCEGIQFVSGLVRDGQTLVLTYGVGDC